MHSVQVRAKATLELDQCIIHVSGENFVLGLKTFSLFHFETNYFGLDEKIDHSAKDGGPHFTQCMIGICPLVTHSYQNLQLQHKILTAATINLGRRNFIHSHKPSLAI